MTRHSGRGALAPLADPDLRLGIGLAGGAAMGLALAVEALVARVLR